jgi:hypothetical protein
VQKLETRLVDVSVGAAEPGAATTNATVRCCHAEVLLLGQILYLRYDPPLSVKLSAGEREHESYRWGSGGAAAEATSAAHAHCGLNSSWFESWSFIFAGQGVVYARTGCFWPEQGVFCPNRVFLARTGCFLPEQGVFCPNRFFFA